MYEILRFRDLDGEQRQKLFGFTAHHDPERFPDAGAMERAYGSSAFEHGETQLSLWRDGTLYGAMAAVIREADLRGETFITAVAIEPGHEDGFAQLLARTLAGMPAKTGLVVRMGISPRHPHIEALAARNRFASDYDGLIMAHQPAAPVTPKDSAFRADVVDPATSAFRVDVVDPTNREDYRRVLDEAFRKSPNGATVDEEQITELMAEIRYADLLGLGWCDGQPVAAYELDIHDDTGWVEALAVDPRQQGKGFGKRMLQAAIARLQSHGATTIKLLVMSANAPAVRLYEQQGFTLERVTARWWRLASEGV